MKLKNIIILLLAAIALTSCDSFLDITPTGKVIAKTGEEYRALLTNEYKYFPKDRHMTTVRTDELQLSGNTSSNDLDAYLDLWLWKDDNPSPTTSYFSWRTYYHNIYIANYIIEHQHEITNAKADEISQLVGEAYMMRAYDLFLLVNLYAEPYTHCTPATTRGVPMLLEADVNAIPGSSSVEAVYQQVLADLTLAEQHMNVSQWEQGKNYRFNKVAAQALRARTYLYMGRWQEALTAAQAVIAAHGDLVDLNATDALLPVAQNGNWYDFDIPMTAFLATGSTLISYTSRIFSFHSDGGGTSGVEVSMEYLYFSKEGESRPDPQPTLPPVAEPELEPVQTPDGLFYPAITSAQKYIRNGLLVIQHQDKYFDVLGRPLTR